MNKNLDKVLYNLHKKLVIYVNKDNKNLLKLYKNNYFYYFIIYY